MYLLTGDKTMRITQEDDYGIRTILYLCKKPKGERTLAKDISTTQCIPERFLLKILRKLAVSDILVSYMGYGGGYAVEKSPSEISLLDVITAVEGPIYINKCLEDKKNCNAGRAEWCVVHKRLRTIQGLLLNALEKVSFQDLLNDEKSI